MHKLFSALLVVPLLLGATVASAEVGGTITKSFVPPVPPTSIETVYDKTNPDIMLISTVAPSAYNQAINALVRGVLQIVDWDSTFGEMTFTDTQYSIKNNCNTLFGTYTVDGTKMNLSTPASTMMACPTDDMVADQRLATSLENIHSITFADGKLVLNGNKITLAFSPDITKLLK